MSPSGASGFPGEPAARSAALADHRSPAGRRHGRASPSAVGVAASALRGHRPAVRGGPSPCSPAAGRRTRCPSCRTGPVSACWCPLGGLTDRHARGPAPAPRPGVSVGRGHGAGPHVRARGRRGGPGAVRLGDHGTAPSSVLPASDGARMQGAARRPRGCRGQYQLLNAATPDPAAAAWRTTRRGPSTSSAASASARRPSPSSSRRCGRGRRPAPRRAGAGPPRTGAERPAPRRRRGGRARTSRGAAPIAEGRGRGTGPRPGRPSGRSPRRGPCRPPRASGLCSRPASRPCPQRRRRRGRPRRGRRTGRRPAWAPGVGRVRAAGEERPPHRRSATTPGPDRPPATGPRARPYRMAVPLCEFPSRRVRDDADHPRSCRTHRRSLSLRSDPNRPPGRNARAAQGLCRGRGAERPRPGAPGRGERLARRPPPAHRPGAVRSAGLSSRLAPRARARATARALP